MSQVQKTSLKPAHEIYARLIWDKTVAPNGEFTVGYEDRFLGVMEATRAEFEEAEIPYHRIRYFKNHEGNIIWHRERRQDLITTRPTTTATAATDSDSEDTNAAAETTEATDTTEATETEASVPAHRSKKAILKEKRARALQQQRESARGEKEEEVRLEREHAEELGNRMEEVEERIKRFQTMLKKSGERTVEGEEAPAEREGVVAEWS